jgi:hypothetical protein
MILIKRLWHGLMHRFGWVSGTPESWHDGHRLMAAWRCSVCGERCMAHEVPSDWYRLS